MLVLSRKSGEAVNASGGITIKVLGIRGSRVQLGIDAPDSVCIWRAEIGGEDAADTGETASGGPSARLTSRQGAYFGEESPAVPVPPTCATTSLR